MESVGEGGGEVQGSNRVERMGVDETMKEIPMNEQDDS